MYRKALFALLVLLPLCNAFSQTWVKPLPSEISNIQYVTRVQGGPICISSSELNKTRIELFDQSGALIWKQTLSNNDIHGISADTIGNLFAALVSGDKGVVQIALTDGTINPHPGAVIQYPIHHQEFLHFSPNGNTYYLGINGKNQNFKQLFQYDTIGLVRALSSGTIYQFTNGMAQSNSGWNGVCETASGVWAYGYDSKLIPNSTPQNAWTYGHVCFYSTDGTKLREFYLEKGAISNLYAEANQLVVSSGNSLLITDLAGDIRFEMVFPQISDFKLSALPSGHYLITGVQNRQLIYKVFDSQSRSIVQSTVLAMDRNVVLATPIVSNYDQDFYIIAEHSDPMTFKRTKSLLYFANESEMRLFPVQIMAQSGDSNCNQTGVMKRGQLILKEQFGSRYYLETNDLGTAGLLLPRGTYTLDYESTDSLFQLCSSDAYLIGQPTDTVQMSVRIHDRCPNYTTKIYFENLCPQNRRGYAEVSGGLGGPYAITWSNGDIGSIADSLSIYYQNITIAEGQCVDTIDLDPVTGGYFEDYLYSCDGTPTEIKLDLPYCPLFDSITWKDGSPIQDMTLEPLADTILSVRFVNSLGCSAVENIQVSSVFFLPTVAVRPGYCGGQVPATAQIELDAVIYDFQWSTGDTTQSITPVVNGDYQITVSYRGCEKIFETNINTDIPVPVFETTLDTSNTLLTSYVAVDQPLKLMRTTDRSFFSVSVGAFQQIDIWLADSLGRTKRTMVATDHTKRSETEHLLLKQIGDSIQVHQADEMLHLTPSVQLGNRPIVTNKAKKIISASDSSMYVLIELSPQGQENIELIHFDKDGQILWSKIYGGSGAESEADLAIDQNGKDAWIACKTKSKDIPMGGDTLGGSDIWLFQVGSQQGEVIKQIRFGGTLDEFAPKLPDTIGNQTLMAIHTQSRKIDTVFLGRPVLQKVVLLGIDMDQLKIDWLQLYPHTMPMRIERAGPSMWDLNGRSPWSRYEQDGSLVFKSIDPKPLLIEGDKGYAPQFRIVSSYYPPTNCCPAFGVSNQIDQYTFKPEPSIELQARALPCYTDSALFTIKSISYLENFPALNYQWITAGLAIA